MKKLNGKDGWEWCLNLNLMYCLKKLDILIILFSITGIIFSFIFFHTFSNRLVLVIYINNQKKIYSLDDADFKVKSSEGSVTVRIRDRRVRVIDSTCPDKWCMRMGTIDGAGESIVCLPSRIFLAIEEEGRNEEKGYDAITR